MTKRHDKKKDRKHVKSNIDIAMEKAEKMSRGEVPSGFPEGPAVSLPEDELAMLKDKASKADEYYEDFLRTAAELENYKKRVERERQDLLKFGQDQIMSDLLLVLDNFGRAMDAADASSGNESLIEGVGLIRKQLLDVLNKNGLEPIDALGKPFNPELHEAIAQEVTDEYPDGTVIAEQLKGYTLNGRLLRPAAVTVSKSPGPEKAD